ncbi:hypothetical protein KAJ87_01735 [Candidatus Pacearchaeota archaeon]|nr:hypothetical protein [Candidatus Pacearchaeota archaeon]
MDNQYRKINGRSKMDNQYLEMPGIKVMWGENSEGYVIPRDLESDIDSEKTLVRKLEEN